MLIFCEKIINFLLNFTNIIIILKKQNKKHLYILLLYKCYQKNTKNSTLKKYIHD